MTSNNFKSQKVKEIGQNEVDFPSCGWEHQMKVIEVDPIKYFVPTGT